MGVGRGGADYLIIMERRPKCLEQLVRAANPYQHLFIMVEMVHLFTRVLQRWQITVEVQPHVRRASNSLNLRSVGGWCHDGPSVYNRCCSPVARLPR